MKEFVREIKLFKPLFFAYFKLLAIVNGLFLACGWVSEWIPVEPWIDYWTIVWIAIAWMNLLMISYFISHFVKERKELRNFFRRECIQRRYSFYGERFKRQQ